MGSQAFMKMPDQQGAIISTARCDMPMRAHYGRTIAAFACLVADCGSVGARGTYTDRGEEAGKRFFNLAGEPVGVFKAVVWDGAGWMVTDDSGSALYRRDENVQYPWSPGVVAWVAIDGALPIPVVTSV